MDHSVLGGGPHAGPVISKVIGLEAVGYEGEPRFFSVPFRCPVEGFPAKVAAVRGVGQDLRGQQYIDVLHVKVDAEPLGRLPGHPHFILLYQGRAEGQSPDTPRDPFRGQQGQDGAVDPSREEHQGGGVIPEEGSDPFGLVQRRPFPFLSF